ncbi:hypoxanthine phosphoribosyltransferase [Clostridia bacterium]|nr:hypoxanthine phosphoribosyltransferase [Clostridia bacterium]
MNKPKEVLLEKRVIEERIEALAKEIDTDYAEANPLLLTLLKGSFYFAADLSKQMQSKHSIDFLTVAHDSSGMLEIRYPPTSSLKDRHVLLIEDIIDSGLTLHYIVDYVQKQGAKSVWVCTLLDNPVRRLVELPIRYLGFTIPDVYVVGYGLDVNEHYRNLSDIHIYEP